MSDQAGDASGGFNATTGVSGGAPDASSFSPPPASVGSTMGASFGAAPSSIVAGGGGNASAPAFSAPPSAPAGFDVSQQGAAALGSSNPAALETAQNVLNAPDPNAPAATAGGGAAAGAVPGAAPAGTNSVLNAIQNPGVNSILNAVGGNLGPLASLGILGFEAANKPGGVGGSGQQLPAAAQPGPTAGALVNQAGTLQTAGQALSTPLATGVLPPGAQASIDQVTQQQEAQIRQQFASMGLTGSTMEAEAIAQARQGAQARGFDLAQKMAQQGLGDLQVSSGIFKDLLNSGLQSDKEFQDALAQFANSLAGGGGGGTTIRVGGT